MQVFFRNTSIRSIIHFIIHFKVNCSFDWLRGKDRVFQSSSPPMVPRPCISLPFFIEPLPSLFLPVEAPDPSRMGVVCSGAHSRAALVAVVVALWIDRRWHTGVVVVACLRHCCAHR